MNIKKTMLLYQMADIVLADLSKEDFILNKEYKIKSTFRQPNGKWSQAFSESVFIDSKHVLRIYSDKLFNNILTKLEKKMKQRKVNPDKQNENITDKMSITGDYEP